MLYVFLILFICTVLAYLYGFFIKENAFETSLKTDNGNAHPNVLSTTSIILLAIILILFSGLRTSMNDTNVYIINYSDKVSDSLTDIWKIDYSIGANPFFQIYQILIKSLVTHNPNGFLLITAFIVLTSIIIFIKKYSVNFGFTIYLFLAFTVYAFTMAALKQTLATCIAIWAIPLALNNKKIRAFILIVFAMLFHPYVLLFFSIFFLSNNIWDRRSVIIIFFVSFAAFAFSSFPSFSVGFASLFGDKYDESYFVGNVNFFRFITYAIVPAASFIFRESIREKNDFFINICINLSFIAMCFSFLSLFGGANMIGRLANYFDIFICISLPYLLRIELITFKQRTIFTIIIFIGFSLFYFTYYNKYLSGLPLTTDIYKHISLFEVIKNW